MNSLLGKLDFIANMYNILVYMSSSKEHGKTRSEASLKRERQRLSEASRQFKSEIEKFLIETSASSHAVYSIKNDLSKKTNHPFYGVKKLKPKPIKEADSILEEYVLLNIRYDNYDFSKKLLTELKTQQGQLIRKIAPKIKDPRVFVRSEWEHAIPTAYVVNELLKMVERKDFSKLSNLIFIYKKAGQRKVSQETHRKVDSLHRDNMPENWRWDTDAPNYLVRYCVAGVISEVAMSNEERNMVNNWFRDQNLPNPLD
jgi:hypothetical protein